MTIMVSKNLNIALNSYFKNWEKNKKTTRKYFDNLFIREKWDVSDISFLITNICFLLYEVKQH